MNKPLISVIVAVYNTEQYVSNCIESIIHQTYDNIQLILVDDGSTDNSGLICDSYAQKDSRITVIHQSNGGSLSAKKAGICAAKGEYVTFVDSDDWIETDLYLNVVSNLNDCDIYAYGLTYVYSNGKQNYEINRLESGTYHDDNLSPLKTRALYDGEIGLFGIMPSMCTKFYKKPLIEKHIINAHNEIRMGEDAVNTFPAICDSSKITVNNELTGYMYRQGIEGAMTSIYRFIENDRINHLFQCLHASFNNLHADYMLEQLPYYLAFLMRIQFVGELSYLRPNNIIKKLKNIQYMYNLEWIKYVCENTSNERLNNELQMFVSNYKHPIRLFLRWYIRKLFK